MLFCMNFEVDDAKKKHGGVYGLYIKILCIISIKVHESWTFR